jgi:uncharacterized protein
MSEPRFTNRLSQETSPYLRQHAHNPVDWYAWGAPALERSRALDRPIFLSIGYSACHWCHVMERESFEDPEVAAYLNEHFVSIKVDREERPDLDQIYMTAVQLLTRQGGWPMSVFLTPQLKPFYGGTYYPPQDMYGRPSFRRILEALVDAWQNRRNELEDSAAQIVAQVEQAGRLEAGSSKLGPETLRRAGNQLGRNFDPVNGGFGSAPKFPHALELRLLLRLWRRFGDDNALHMACLSLDRMARGGIYDQLGGGFHRYSTDERWLAPHFEKMLYDNALLSQAYLEAFLATGQAAYKQVVIETLDYVLREMMSPEGGFFSTQDADSEGEEGKFFVWSAAEVEATLGPDAAKLFTYVYDVTPGGNWEGSNILHRPKSAEQEARMLDIDAAELAASLTQSRRQLFEVRSRRLWPGRDDKILTAWNGLMLRSLAQAARALAEPRYADAARKNASFLLEKMRAAGGRLFRTYFEGVGPKLNAYLEDYACLIEALISVYEMDGDEKWLSAALDLTGVMIDEFWDEKDSGFFFTGNSHETLLTRTKDPHDSSTPSGNSVAATALLRLARLTGRDDLLAKGTATLELFSGLMDTSPTAAAQMLIALDFHIGPGQEFVIVGDRKSRPVQTAHHAVGAIFLPHAVTAWSDGRAGDAGLVGPLVAGKKALGDLTTYVCQNFACGEPLVGVEALQAKLREAKESAQP